MYQSTITGIGALALDFLDENMLILFGQQAPSELAEISVLHSTLLSDQNIELGDFFCIGNEKYIVTAVGSEVNHTFQTMGHCTLSFKGRAEATMPGILELKGNRLPQITIGNYIQIHKGQKEE